MADPRIHLGIDNCFAIKRWTEPSEWGRVVKDLGMKYVEAVPDLECEPLLTPVAVQKDWADQVNRLREETGVRVIMSYSNDSTYDTIGFSHPDKRVRDYLVHEWFGRFIDTCSAIGSDVGFYVQATPENLLYDKEGRKIAFEHACECICEVNRMAAGAGIAHVALEQMYTPHQPPFTIIGMEELIRQVTLRSGAPFFLTEDVGHHCRKYLCPSDEQLKEAARRYAEDGWIDVWLGSTEAVRIFEAEAKQGDLSSYALQKLRDDFLKNADMFNEEDDTDCYAWLSRLGAWSPVIHMQQTDGTHSSHDPFTAANNAVGKIHPVQVLKALKRSYDLPADKGMPPVCDDIYLIQELYLSTKDIGYQGIHKLKESTDYLRKYIPEDGMKLSELLDYNRVSG